MLTRTTSTVLARRTSSLTLRFRRNLSAVPQVSQSGSVSFLNAKPRLPTEIVEIIINFVVCSYTDWALSAIKALIRASKAFREIGLRLSYREVILGSRARFGRFWVVLCGESARYNTDAFGWVRCATRSFLKRIYSLLLTPTLRILVVPSHTLGPRAGFLGSFTNLRVLEICLATEGLSTQDTFVELLLDSFTHSASGTRLKKLVFTAIPRIDTSLLASVARAFPRLTTLELTSTERIDYDCCLGCLEGCLHSTRHSPIPDHYPTVEKLATSFANAVSALDRVENIYLGFYLSDASVFEEHVAHVDDPRGGRGVLTDLFSCPVCKKHSEEVQERERIAATILARTLPSLKLVRWDTLFSPELQKNSVKNEGDEDGFYFRGDDTPIAELRPSYTSTFVVAPREERKEVQVTGTMAPRQRPLKEKVAKLS